MVAQAKDKDTEWRPPEGAFDPPPGGSDIPFWDDSWKDELPGWISGATMRDDGSVWGYNYSGGYGNLWKGGGLHAKHYGQEGTWGFTGEAEIEEGGASPKPWSWTPPDDAYEPPTPSDAGGTGSGGGYGGGGQGGYGGGGVTKTAEASFGNYHRIYNDDGTATIFPIDESLKIAAGREPDKDDGPYRPAPKPGDPDYTPPPSFPGQDIPKLAQGHPYVSDDSDLPYNWDGSGEWPDPDDLQKEIDSLIDPATGGFKVDSNKLGGEIAQIASADLGGLGIADQNKVAALLEAGDLAQKKQNLKDTWGIVRESEQVADAVQGRKAPTNTTWDDLVESDPSAAEIQKTIEDTEFTFGDAWQTGKDNWNLDTFVEGGINVLSKLPPAARDTILDAVGLFPLGPVDQQAGIIKSAFSGKQEPYNFSKGEMQAFLDEQVRMQDPDGIYNPKKNTETGEYDPSLVPSDRWWYKPPEAGDNWFPHSDASRGIYPSNATQFIGQRAAEGDIYRPGQQIIMGGEATAQILPETKYTLPSLQIDDASYLRTNQETAAQLEAEAGPESYKGAEWVRKYGGTKFQEEVGSKVAPDKGVDPEFLGFQSRQGNLKWSDWSEEAKEYYKPEVKQLMDTIIASFEEAGPSLSAAGVNYTDKGVQSKIKYKKATPSNYKKDKTYDVLQSPLIWNQKQGTGASGKKTYQTFGLNI